MLREYDVFTKNNSRDFPVAEPCQKSIVALGATLERVAY
jgi:hypothetical protein